ncbi:2-dehydropantoate 2-reductase N-terminal domain-containing protein [Micromonospora sp. 4G55]|uniref:2-dehydropantoate 2-reductase N-terminal domain-containing protein n=1 Tax=Micromonospora sp. 4G55 TaxID=2806102 RepID=UPI0035C7128D
MLCQSGGAGRDTCGHGDPPPGGCSFGSVRTVCVVGAGAVGGVIGARLALAGLPVSALARNETLTSLRTHGWLLSSRDGGPQAPRWPRPPTTPRHWARRTS